MKSLLRMAHSDDINQTSGPIATFAVQACYQVASRARQKRQSAVASLHPTSMVLLLQRGIRHLLPW